MTSNNEVLWNDDINSNSDNMQLAHPEPRQVIECASHSFLLLNIFINI